VRGITWTGRCGAVLAVVLLAGVVLPGAARAETFGFESGTFEGWSTKERCSDDDHRIVSSPTRSGDFAAQVEMQAGECGRTKRAEFYRTDGPAEGERWYSWSFLVPESVQPDSDFWIFTQLHQTPGSCSWGRPPVTFRIRGNDIEFRNDWKTGACGTPFDHHSETIGTLDRGRWHDMVVRAVWSTGSDGVVEVWLDGQQVVQRRGPNNWENHGNIFMKFGIYKGSQDNTLDKTIYFDDIVTSSTPLSPGTGAAAAVESETPTTATGVRAGAPSDVDAEESEAPAAAEDADADADADGSAGADATADADADATGAGAAAPAADAPDVSSASLMQRAQALLAQLLELLRGAA